MSETSCGGCGSEREAADGAGDPAKSGGLLREGGRRAVGECYSFIAAEKSNFPVAVMCRVFDVSRTGFHNWERRAPSDRTLTDAWLIEKIKLIHEQSRGVYGVPRIHAELRIEHEVRISRKRVARLMKAAGISGVRPRKRFKRRSGSRGSPRPPTLSSATSTGPARTCLGR